MRAVLSVAPGGPETLVVGDAPEPELFAEGVLIDVKAAAVNFPDLLVIEDKYQLRPPRPFSPGGEVAGVVRAVGADVKHLKAGDRVLANVGVGGFAERALAPAERTFAIPDAMPFDVASSLLFTYGTTYHALVDRAQVRPGERMLVLGAAGGVGVAAIQLGRALGLEVVAAARGADRLAFCAAQGATATIDYEAEDLKARLKALGGVDVVYDAVGGDHSEPALRGLRPGGRFLVIGFAAGSIPRIPLNLVLLKECSVVGVQWGAWALREPEAQAAEVRALVKLWEEKRIAPQVEGRFPLERAGEALQALAQRRVRGKVVVVP
jgi:NADPH2:quinone reductase